MLAIRNPYAVYTRLNTYLGTVTWFAVVITGVIAYAYAFNYVLVEGFEVSSSDAGGSGLVILGVIWGVITLIGIAAGIGISIDEENFAVFPVAVLLLAAGAWVLCGTNYWMWPTRMVGKSDQVRILADGGVQRFGDPAIPRGVFKTRSIILARHYSHTEVNIIREGNATLRETVQIEIVLRSDRIEDVVREFQLVKQTGPEEWSITGNDSKVPAAIKEMVVAALLSKRLKGEPIVSGPLEPPMPWIESVTITKVVRERTEVSTEVR